MTCFHPLKGFVLGEKENGKKDLKVCSRDVQYISYNYSTGKYTQVRSNNGIGDIDNKFLASTHISDNHVLEVRDFCIYNDYIDIPCGQCIGCRIDKSKEWANRLMLEIPYSDSAYFVTLTYNNEELPLVSIPDSDGVFDAESFNQGTLVKRDLQLFMKRLRKRFPASKVDEDGNLLANRYGRLQKPIRFYACGEYGTETFRPHYHLILFNVPFDDLFYWKNTPEGNLYRSPILEQLWPFGNSCVAEVSWNTCAYVARYVTKKFRKDWKPYYDDFGLEPEFSLMSRRPGIGKAWYDDHSEEVYETYIIRLTTPQGPIKFHPPRYFDRIYDLENHEKLQEFKDINKKRALERMRIELEKTDVTYEEYLQIREDNFKRKTAILKRGDTDA